MIQLPMKHEAFLQDQLPHGWEAARDRAAELVAQTEFLTWPDRAAVLDTFLWKRARTMLSNEEITAVINRLRHCQGGSYAVLEYATVCGSILTGVVLQLKEPGEIASPFHTLTFLLSRKVEHQQLGARWVQALGQKALEEAMSTLPGYAFMFLATYPNDSAESFMARDAFWAAMLGR
ncbi:MAG: hypothetical protein KDG54_03295 [Geminicoccaceae bacterium]|nr:hypothetical protein [Geminicoccaceae bacterium]